MKLLDWILDKNNKKSKANPSTEITVEKAKLFVEEVEKLNKLDIFLKRYLKTLVESEQNIREQIEYIKAKTNQNLDQGLLIKELWILRYVYLQVWFFDLRSPANKDEANENHVLINHSFQNVLEKSGKAKYLDWFEEGLLEYTGTDKLTIQNFNTAKQLSTDKLAEKIPRIAFDCTGGRLSGTLHDFLIELLMNTIELDRKRFEMRDDTSLTEEEASNIKNIVSEMNLSKKHSISDLLSQLDRVAN